MFNRGEHCARQHQRNLGFMFWVLAECPEGRDSLCVDFDNRSSRTMYFGQFTKYLNYMSEESLHTKICSQELGVMGM